MNRYLIIVCWILVSFESFGQDISGESKADSNMVVTRISKVTPDRYFDYFYGIFRTNKYEMLIYDSTFGEFLSRDTAQGKIIEEYTYRNDTLNGPFYQRYNDSIVLVKGFYKDGKLNGELLFYDISHYKKRGECNFLNCLPKYEVLYSNGMKNGRYIIREATGDKLQEGYYINNKRIGPVINYDFYFENDKQINCIAGVEIFNENNSNSDFYNFYSNGALKIFATLKSGEFTHIRYYSPQNELIREEKWKKGKLQKVVFPKKEKDKYPLIYDTEFLLRWQIEE